MPKQTEKKLKPELKKSIDINQESEQIKTSEKFDQQHIAPLVYG